MSNPHSTLELTSREILYYFIQCRAKLDTMTEEEATELLDFVGAEYPSLRTMLENDLHYPDEIVL